MNEEMTFDEAMNHRALLAHIRHELRTPINAIIGYSELLIEDLEEDNLDPAIPGLKRVHTAGKELLTLVGDLLNPEPVFVEALKGDPEAFGAHARRELRKPVEVVIGSVEPLIAESTMSGRDQLLPDLERILTAARNLLAHIEDIVRFSQAGGTEGGDVEEDDGAAMVHDALARMRVPIEVGRSMGTGGSVLVVDDKATNRDLLARRLAREGYTVATAENGRIALEMIYREPFDLILLDIMMPEVNGFEVLEAMKTDEKLRHVPVIMISALTELESVLRCVEMGADDYLPKPYDPVLLRARVGAIIEKKRLRDREQSYLEQLRVERERTENLLLNVLPKPIVERLKGGEKVIADHFPEVTVLFADLVGFTGLAMEISPVDLVCRLNDIFSAFDKLAERYGLEKIKTIGDSYMVVGGMPEPRPDHAQAVAAMALDMLEEMPGLGIGLNRPLRMRIGIHSGPVVAGIIGTRKFAYDLWGDTVNTASRMESHGVPGAVQVSEATYSRLQGLYRFEERGAIEVKSKGLMRTWLLTGRI